MRNLLRNIRRFPTSPALSLGNKTNTDRERERERERERQQPCRRAPSIGLADQSSPGQARADPGSSRGQQKAAAA